MIPHERSLVARMQDKPFVLIGVNSDGDLAEYRKQAAAQQVTWRNFADGSTSGPIATKWNIRGWPTLFLIDHLGVIRSADLMPDDIDAKVDALVAEAVAAAKAGPVPKPAGKQP